MQLMKSSHWEFPERIISKGIPSQSIRKRNCVNKMSHKRDYWNCSNGSYKGGWSMLIQRAKGNFMGEGGIFPTIWEESASFALIFSNPIMLGEYCVNGRIPYNKSWLFGDTRSTTPYEKKWVLSEQFGLQKPPSARSRSWS